MSGGLWKDGWWRLLWWLAADVAAAGAIVVPVVLLPLCVHDGVAAGTRVKTIASNGLSKLKSSMRRGGKTWRVVRQCSQDVKHGQSNCPIGYQQIQ